jgi:hypothetical protein
MQESRRETERLIQESQRETDRLMRESQREMERVVKETSRSVGGLQNSFGELAEHLVAPNIEEKFNALGYHFKGFFPNAKIKKIGRAHV